MAKKQQGLKNVKASANKVWHAGLGALAQAEKRGDKLFKTLVKKGKKYEDALRETLDTATDAVEDSVKAARSKASKTYKNVESKFDAQLEATVSRLGFARQSEVDSLKREIAKLKARGSRKKAVSAKKKTARAKKKTKTTKKKKAQR